MHRPLSLSVAGAALAVLLAGPAHAAPTTFPGSNGRIAFASHNQIYTISPSGSGRRQLTSTGKNYRPAWSADGKRLAYTHEDGNGSLDIWVMQADGSGKQQITTSHHISGGASWSPDGRTLLFANNGFVYTITLADRHVRALTACFDEEADYTDNPVGTPCQPDQDVNQLQAVGPPAWSPNGRYIVLTAVGAIFDQLVEVWSGNNNSIHIEAAEGGGGSYGRFGATYSWAPDSTSFLVPHSGPSSRSLIASYTLKVPGSHPRKVVSVRGDQDPAHSPDARRFLVVNSSSGAPLIFVSNVDGTGRHQLVGGSTPAWQPL